MKSVFWFGKSNFLLVVLVVLVLGGCKKSKVTPDPDAGTAFGWP